MRVKRAQGPNAPRRMRVWEGGCIFLYKRLRIFKNVCEKTKSSNFWSYFLLRLGESESQLLTFCLI